MPDVVHIIKDSRTITIAAKHEPYADEIKQNFDYYHMLSATPDFSQPRYHQIPGYPSPLFFTGIPESVTETRQYTALINLQPGDTVIDAGAYCGLSSILFAQAVGHTGKVIALEPDPANYEAARLNTADMTSITLHQIALWHTTGSIPMNCEGNMGSSTEGRYDHITTVHAITPSDLTADLIRLDAIKIDIEGAEYRIMDELAPILQRFQPRIVIETHGDTDPILSKLLSFGYNCTVLPQSYTKFPLITGTP